MIRDKRAIMNSSMYLSMIFVEAYPIAKGQAQSAKN
jgi:hypothetical protein